MSEGNESRLDAQELLARVRKVVGRTAPPERAPGADRPRDAVSSQLLGRMDEALSRADRSWQVGSKLPPMTKVRGLLRALALPVAKAILRAAELVARDQRSYNRAALDALTLTRSALEDLPKLRRELRELREEVAALRADLERSAPSRPG